MVIKPIYVAGDSFIIKTKRVYNDSKAFIEYSYDMHDIYKSIEKYNPCKKT